MRSAKIISALALVAALSSAGVVAAQTTTATTTPGTPETGVGGDVAGNLALLGSSALVALAGAAYISRKLITN